MHSQVTVQAHLNWQKKCTWTKKKMEKPISLNMEQAQYGLYLAVGDNLKT